MQPCRKLWGAGVVVGGTTEGQEEAWGCGHAHQVGCDGFAGRTSQPKLCILNRCSVLCGNYSSIMWLKAITKLHGKQQAPQRGNHGFSLAGELRS